MNDTWEELLATSKKDNSSDEMAYETIYEEMLSKFPSKMLEDFEIDPKTKEATKRSSRVKCSPPPQTEPEDGAAVVTDEVEVMLSVWTAT